MWQIIVELAVIGALYGYHRWLEPHPKTSPSAANTPRVDEGAPFPIIYGTCLVKAPILAWWGNQRSLPVFSGGALQGFAYFIDMQYLVGIPFQGGTASLNAVFANGFPMSAQPASTYLLNGVITTLHNLQTVDNSIPRYGDPNAVGRSNFFCDNFVARDIPFILSETSRHVGYEESGGINAVYRIGLVEFWSGAATQTISDGIDDMDVEAQTDTQGAMEGRPMNRLYFYQNSDDDLVFYTFLGEGILPSRSPSYRGVAVACMYRWCNGMGTSIPPYAFEVTSLSTGSSSDLGHSLALDADPAAVILDILTGSWAKVGLPMSKIDLPSFQAASLTLVNEGHGYSRSFEAQQTEAAAMLREVQMQIGGTCYEEPSTGKIVLKLIRFDYNIATVLDVNPDNTAAPADGWYTIQGWSETFNQVLLTYTNRAENFADATIIAQNTANIVSQANRIRSVNVRYPGCCTLELARKLASRDLAVISRPNVKAKVVVNRQFYLTRPGDVVTLTWPKLGVSKMAMRVSRVDLGQLYQGAITLDLVRDVFDTSIGAYPRPS